MNNSLRNLWIKKSNFLEELYFKNKNKYYLIDNSIDYYMAMLELAIYYLKDKNNSIYVKEKYFSNYLKEIFFNNKYKNIDYKGIIIRGIGIFRYELVIARMVFPSYYFDKFDDIVLNNKEQSILNNVVNKQNEYNNYIKNIINIIGIIPEKKIPF